MEKLGTTESERLSDAAQRHVLEGVVAMVTGQQEVLEQKAGSDLNVACIFILPPAVNNLNV